MKLHNIVAVLDSWLFSHRRAVLGSLLAFTLAMGFFASSLRLEAGFEKQMPIGHPYIETFQKYRASLFGANRLTVVVKARQGTIWTQPGLTRLYDVTQSLMLAPNIDRLGVKSLWTPNTYVDEITEEGFRHQPVIPGTITASRLNDSQIADIQRSAAQGGYIGSLVSRDQSAAMITAELLETDRFGTPLDYVAYNRMLEEQIRKPFEDAEFTIEIIGFAKQIGDIADGASGVLVFFGIALAFTAAAVYWYCHSIRFTILPIACSLTSLVWQFGTLRLLGFGLDPLAVLVPFLVFAIGVSHGVQQINFIVRCLAQGKSTMASARDSFTGLLVPGTLALMTALVSFVTLALIPIPMIRELAITASLGVGYKIVTNLIMLPLTVSFCRFDAAYAKKAMAKREQRTRLLRMFAWIVGGNRPAIVSLATLLLLGLSIWESRDRVVGTVQPGAPELRREARFNRDAVDIASNFDLGLDWLTIVIEAPPQSCENAAVGQYVDMLTSELAAVPGVTSAVSYATMLRTYNEGYNEGLPKMAVVPTDPANYSALTTEIGRVRGFNNKDCSMTALHLYLTDHKTVTLNRVIDAAKRIADSQPHPGIVMRLASGNAGIVAATNDEISRAELPMMLYVYAAIIAFVFAVYRDLRATIACCLPLTVATFIGYWIMKELEIGLTVATLPVMVLAVGIGVDYALYIYNRLQMHLARGDSITQAMEHALEFEGMATIFTAITLAVGVATWSFSELQFQADMGKLLALMFMVNLVMAFTALPALAVMLERLFPRSRPARVPGFIVH